MGNSPFQSNLFCIKFIFIPHKLKQYTCFLLIKVLKIKFKLVILSAIIMKVNKSSRLSLHRHALELLLIKKFLLSWNVKQQALKLGDFLH